MSDELIGWGFCVILTLCVVVIIDAVAFALTGCSLFGLYERWLS